MVIDIKRINGIALGLYTAGLLLAASVAAAQENSPITDDNRADYQTVYGEKLTSVKRTRSVNDDRTLAREMMAFAKQSSEDPGVQCLLYIDTITLASNAAELGMMNEATNQLHERWPEQDAVSPEALMQLASRGYRGVDRSDRDEQGEHYIDLLLGMAERYIEDDDPDQAGSIYRLASTIARTIDSQQEAYIQNKIKRLTAVSEMNRRIKMLELSLEKNPQNKPAAKELVELFVAQRDDIAAAQRYVHLTGDEEMIDVVRRCAQGTDQANAAAALRIGDWHAELAEDEEGEPLLTLLKHAHAWYGRFFALYTRDDALADHVKGKHTLVQLKIQQLTGSTPADTDGWDSLIAPPFDATTHTIGKPDQLEINNGVITIEAGALFIPFNQEELSDAYEVRLTITVNQDVDESRPVLTLHLPAGDQRVLTARYYVEDDQIASVDDVNETRLEGQGRGKIGVKTQLTYQIDRDEDQVAFAMLYNGKPAAKWKGDSEALKKVDEEALERFPDDVGPLMVLRSLGNVTLHAIEYRAHSD